MKKSSMFMLSVALFIIGVLAVIVSMILNGFEEINAAVLVCQVVCILSLVGLLALKLSQAQSVPDEEEEEFIFDEDNEFADAADQVQESQEEETEDYRQAKADELENSKDTYSYEEEYFPEEEIVFPIEQEKDVEEIPSVEEQQEQENGQPAEGQQTIVQPEGSVETEDYQPDDTVMEELMNAVLITEEKKTGLKIQRLRRVKNYTGDLPKAFHCVKYRR